MPLWCRQVAEVSNHRRGRLSRRCGNFARRGHPLGRIRLGGCAPSPALLSHLGTGRSTTLSAPHPPLAAAIEQRCGCRAPGRCDTGVTINRVSSNEGSRPYEALAVTVRCRATSSEREGGCRRGRTSPSARHAEQVFNLSAGHGRLRRTRRRAPRKCRGECDCG